MAKFKTRARTVDMLGRQQIAGASTALSELFKKVVKKAGMGTGDFLT